MSLDDRLRQRFEEAGSAVLSDAERHLHQVVRIGRRRRLVRRSASVAAAVLAVATITGTVPTLLERTRDSAPSGPTIPATPTPGQQDLAGAYSVVVPRGAEGAGDLAGRWRVEIGDDGLLDVTAPPGFEANHSGFSVQATGNQLRTDLFDELCAGSPVGHYFWTRRPAGLTFEAIDDSCAPRFALFTSGTWVAVEQ